MFRKWSKSGFSTQDQQRKNLVLAIVVIVALLCLIAFVAVAGFRLKDRSGNDRKEILKYWEAGSYEEVYKLSLEGLEKKPLDVFLLTLYGYSSYQLAIVQVNTSDTLLYIDSCIWALRKALLAREGLNDPRIRYMLGKAYYYKGPEYADLAIQYLEDARKMKYEAPDIPEYLGLSYAAVEDYRSSVEILTQALDPDGGEDAYISDLRLLAIARSYIGLGEGDSAGAYLIRCIETSRDADIVIQARMLFGNTLREAGDFSGAEAQFKAVLEASEENAEAHFQLGELFAAAGDLTRARAEWRRALRADPAHKQARARLNM